MSQLENLRSAKNRKELASLLGFQPSALTSIIYKTPLADRYSTFEIPKKSGGTRTIKAPNDKLKKLQRHLAHLLYNCLAEIEDELSIASVSYGFRQNGSIIANAKNHKRRRYVLNIDIENFFPSFHFGRVRGFFLKNKFFALEDEVATTIAQIACDGEALPQGSPCSPVISELIANILDLRLLRLAKEHGVRYSRYADDLTFSTNSKKFPDAIASEGALGNWTLGNELVEEIDDAWFTINHAKTRMHCRGNRQLVTGLVVNEKANIKSEYYRNARAMCDSLFTQGRYYKSKTSPEDADAVPQPIWTSNLNPLEGILSHIYDVTQSEERRPVPEQRNAPRAIRALYRRFLFYKKCVALTAPLIITEGKTDPIYLREAIRHRNVFQPVLGSMGDEAFEFAVNFFNYEGSSHELMDLGGGSGDLRSIPLDYRRNLAPAKEKKRKPMIHTPMSYPVILVLDNDDGLSAVTGTIKKNFGVQIDKTTTDDFYQVIQNLYVVKVPETTSDAQIESLFPDSVQSIKLNGKAFSTKDKIDPEKEYSKAIFAKSVIRPNADKIDFSGFDPLLHRIVAAIDHYDANGPKAFS